MAELNQTPAEPKRSRSRKLTSRVDLTAMVDLAFLLITFFMLTTSLTQPKAMDLTMPEDGKKPLAVDENRTMTILIGPNDRLKTYMGLFEAGKTKSITTGNGLRKEISARQKDALAYSDAKGESGKGLIVLIKPDAKSRYENLVDVLDEMAISDVPTYAITDIAPEESKLLR